MIMVVLHYVNTNVYPQESLDILPHALTGGRRFHGVFKDILIRMRCSTNSYQTRNPSERETQNQFLERETQNQSGWDFMGT